MHSFIIGLLLILFGGFLQGSFAVFFRWAKPLKWEIYWSIYAIVGLIIAPTLFALFTIPHLANALFSLSTQDLFIPVLFGALWGISGIYFGRSLQSVGIGITYAIVLGLSMLLGVIFPLFFSAPKFSLLLFLVLLGGLLLFAIGIAVSSYIGKKKNSISAIFPALISGLFSPMLTYGFLTSQKIAVAATTVGGASSSMAISLVWLVLLVSSSIVTLLYTAFIIGKDSTRKIFKEITVKSLLACSMAGLFWFGGFILYSLGPAKLGNFGNSYAWAIFITISLLAANLCAVIAGEWRGKKRLFRLQLVSLLVILLGAALISVVMR